MKGLYKGLEFKAIGELSLQKSEDGSGRRIIRGYASVSDVLDRQNEVITHEALVKAKDDLLRNSTIFYEHKHSELPVGKTIATHVDEKGLLITVEFTKAAFAEDLWRLIQEGIINRFSIGGRVTDAHETRDKQGNLFTEITGLELFETSIVGLPANPEARFELVSKSFNKAITEEIRKKGGRDEMAEDKTEKKVVSPAEAQEEVKDKAEETVEGTKETEVTMTDTTDTTTTSSSADVSVSAEDAEETTSGDSAEEPTSGDSVEDVDDDEVEDVEEDEEVEEEEDSEKSNDSVDLKKTEYLETKDAEEIVAEIEEAKTEAGDEIQKTAGTGITTNEDGHWHTYRIDESGNGMTEGIVGPDAAKHVHEVVDGMIQEADGHTHTIVEDQHQPTQPETEEVEEAKSEEEVVEQTKAEEQTSLETKSDEDVEVEEEVVEVNTKDTDAQILEVLQHLVTLLSEKKKEDVTEKSEEVEDESAVVEEGSEEVTTDVKETEKATEEVTEEVAENVESEEAVVAKSEETELNKTVEPEAEKKQLETKDKEEEAEKPAVRKGEVFIAEAPYADGEESKQTTLTKAELEKRKNAAWSKIIFGDK